MNRAVEGAPHEHECRDEQDHDLTCDFWGAGGLHLTLANSVGPAVELIVYDDDYANTIVITEVSS